jgi:hypothetical protein
MELSELTTAAALLFDNKEYKEAVMDISKLKNFCDQSIQKIKKNNIVFGNESTKNQSIELLTLKKGDIYSNENIKIMKDFLVGISAAKEIKIFEYKSHCPNNFLTTNQGYLSEIK